MTTRADPTPRNNPGNLRFSSTIKWLGQTGQQGGFCVFDTLHHGARALAIDLKNAQQIHHLNTVARIITVYAPPNENDTKAYVAAVCKEMGVDRDDTLNLSLGGTLTALVCAV